MISLQDLKRNYVKFYSEVRNYIWPFETVEDLAELEIALFERFPDMHEVRNLFHKFRSDIFREMKEYETLEKAVNDFQEFLDQEDEIFSQLDSVTEVYTDEGVEEEESDEGNNQGVRSSRPRVRVSRSDK